MQTLYLKGYYGYRNWGDELLFFGVVDWLWKNYDIDTLYVEVSDVAWMEDRSRLHPTLLSDDRRSRIVFVAKDLAYKIDIQSMLLVLGGGEVLTDEITIHDDQSPSSETDDEEGLTLDSIRRSDPSFIRTSKNILGRLTQTITHIGSRFFPRVGYNYLFRYWSHIYQGRFILLGGVTDPHKPMTYALYSYMLPKAQRVVLRDQGSLSVVSPYRTDTELYRDFGLDIVSRCGDVVSTVSKPYGIINLHPKSINEQARLTITDIINRYPDYTRYRFPADIICDQTITDQIIERFPQCILRDRTVHTIPQTLGLFAHASYVVGSRLHVLLLAQRYQCPLYPFAYASKITKLINIYHSVLFISRDIVYRTWNTQRESSIRSLRIRQQSTHVVCSATTSTIARDYDSYVINQRSITPTKDRYHHQLFGMLKKRGDDCHCVSLLVDDSYDMFSPLISYCLGVDITVNVCVVGSDASVSHRRSLFPSLNIVTLESASS